MLVKARAILLKKIKYGEKNLILQTFTREQGPQAFFLGSSLLKGKSKTSMAALGIYSIIARKGKGNMLRVTEMELAEKNYNLISNLTRSSIVMFLNEVILKVVKEYDTDIELFDFICTSLSQFDRMKEDNVNFHLKFMIDFTRLLGFYPNGSYSDKTSYFNLSEGQFEPNLPINTKFLEPNLGRLLGKIMALEMEETSGIKLTNEERRTLLSSLIDYFRIHIEGFDDLKSVDVLETVLA